MRHVRLKRVTTFWGSVCSPGSVGREIRPGSVSHRQAPKRGNFVGFLSGASHNCFVGGKPP